MVFDIRSRWRLLDIGLIFKSTNVNGFSECTGTVSAFKGKIKFRG